MVVDMCVCVCVCVCERERETETETERALERLCCYYNAQSMVSEVKDDSFLFTTQSHNQKDNWSIFN